MIKLTIEQYTAVEKMLNFMNNIDNFDNEYLLTGFAGTGKSTLIQYFLKKQKNIKRNKIIIATPTHTVTAVGSDLIAQAKSTSRFIFSRVFGRVN